MTKQFVITDPCYILPEDIWQKIVKDTNEQSDVSGNWDGIFNDLTFDALRDFSKSTLPMRVASTGIGDWSNKIQGNGKIIQSEFGADAGMVCVCEYTDTVKEALKDYPERCFAIIETEDETIDIFMDTENPQWTTLYLSDSKHNWCSYEYCYSQEEDYDDYEEDESYW